MESVDTIQPETGLLRALGEIGALIHQIREEHLFLAEAVARVQRVLDFPYTAIFLHDGEQLMVAAQANAPAAPPSPLPEWSAALTALLHAPDLDEVRVVDARILGLSTAVIVPLLTTSAPLGALVVATPEGGPVVTTTLAALRVLGQLLTHGLREKRLQVKLDAVARKLASASERQQHEQFIDPLTGLVNRTYLLDDLQRAVGEAIRTGEPLSLVMVDLDHFHAANELYGTQFGDGVLQQIADTILGSIRSRDLAARASGEEFGVLLPATPGVGAVVVAERLRERIATLPFSTSAGVSYLTVSLGVACLSQYVTSAEGLLNKAEQGLLQAKGLGGNQVMFDWDEALIAAGDGL